MVRGGNDRFGITEGRSLYRNHSGAPVRGLIIGRVTIVAAKAKDATSKFGSAVKAKSSLGACDEPGRAVKLRDRVLMSTSALGRLSIAGAIPKTPPLSGTGVKSGLPLFCKDLAFLDLATFCKANSPRLDPFAVMLFIPTASCLLSRWKSG